MKSPNYSKTSNPKIGYIIHGTLGNYEGALNWLCTPPHARPVVSYSSAHYVIAKDGRYEQLVWDNDVAWHAGNISNPNERAKAVLPKEDGKFMNPNESFIGIELEWLDVNDEITEAQYDAVTKIIKGGDIKNPIILCHKDVTDYKADFPNSDQIIATITKKLQGDEKQGSEPLPVQQGDDTKVAITNNNQKTMIQSAVKSKTVWLGVLVACIPVLQALQAVPMSPEMASVVTSILGALVVINRFFTNVPISQK